MTISPKDDLKIKWIEAAGALQVAGISLALFGQIACGFTVFLPSLLMMAWVTRPEPVTDETRYGYAFKKVLSDD